PRSRAARRSDRPLRATASASDSGRHASRRAAHGPPHVSEFGPHAAPTVVVQTDPHELMLVSKQYCGCGNCAGFAGHWQQLAPTTFWVPQAPVCPLQTRPASASVPCSSGHLTMASGSSASKHAPTAWQQRVPLAGSVVVVAVPGSVVVGAMPPSVVVVTVPVVVVVPAAHVQRFVQCCPAPQPVPPSHCSPSPGSTSPSPHPAESSASLKGRLYLL